MLRLLGMRLTASWGSCLEDPHAAVVAPAFGLIMAASKIGVGSQIRVIDPWVIVETVRPADSEFGLTMGGRVRTRSLETRVEEQFERIVGRGRVNGGRIPESGTVQYVLGLGSDRDDSRAILRIIRVISRGDERYSDGRRRDYPRYEVA